MNTNGISMAYLSMFREEMEKFVVFNDEEWSVFKTRLMFLSLPKKEFLIKEGQICDHIAFICKGSVRYYSYKDGVDITNYFSFEGELAGAYRSFIKREPGLVNIVLLEHTDFILISWKQMQEMLSDPLLSYKMERFGRLVAEYYCCCYEERMSSFLTQNPEERYLKLMETDKEILQKIPQRYIANFLGITPVSLSRIRKRLLKH